MQFFAIFKKTKKEIRKREQPSATAVHRRGSMSSWQSLMRGFHLSTCHQGESAHSCSVEKAERQSSTWGAHCWPSGRKWEDGHTFYSQGVVTSVSKDVSWICACDSGPQPPATAHLTGASRRKRMETQLLEHSSD